MNNENLCYEGEIWKDIENYEGLYQVSNYGRVKSLPRMYAQKHGIIEKILKLQDSNGYLKCQIYKNGKQKRYFLHRLMAIAFIPNPNFLPCINHIDGNKLNNKIENLEWCTRSQNVRHAYKLGLIISRKGEKHPRARLKEIDVKNIRYLYGNHKYSRRELAKIYCIGKTTLQHIICRDSWNHI